MSGLKTWTAVLLLCCLPACGRQVVQFGLDAASDGGIDRGKDATPDLGQDSTANSDLPAGDRPSDTGSDVSADGLADVRTDVDASVDLGVDGNSEVRTDVSTDVGADLGADVRVDLGVDVSVDLGAEVGIDLGVAEAGIDLGVAEVGIDLGADLSLDLGVDVNGDLALDTPMDASSDTGADLVTGSTLAVLSTLPVRVGINVPHGAVISATFNRPMNDATLDMTTFILKQGTTTITGAVTYVAGTRTVRLVPGAPLGSNLIYTATITIGARDSTGLTLATDYTWTFTTSVDTLPPVITATTPVSTLPPVTALNISINERPTATFSRAMDPGTLTPLTFTLKRGLVTVPGTVTLVGTTNTAVFTPDAPLELDTIYTATVTTGAKDLAGDSLLLDYVWLFRTAACSQASITLRSSASFVVLAGATVTNTGPTSITGDLGVSPGTAITGFPPGLVVGLQHPGDSASAQAIADLTTAYNEAAGRTVCPVSVIGNLGGQTLAPGLYKSTGSLEISSGNLTLDARGDGDAVFVFQMASTLSSSSGLKVLLINGAKAANVYWQVGTSATLGTTSAFQGTIMADQAISLETGATLNGRALARIAGITLDSNTVVTPAP